MRVATALAVLAWSIYGGVGSVRMEPGGTAQGLVFGAAVLAIVAAMAWVERRGDRRQEPAGSGAASSAVERVETAERILRAKFGGWPVNAAATPPSMVLRELRKTHDAMSAALDAMVGATAPGVANDEASADRLRLARLRTQIAAAELVAVALFADRYCADRMAGLSEIRKPRFPPNRVIREGREATP